MDTPKPVAEMTDQELIREYECVECDTVDEDDRTKALVGEMAQRDIDF